MASALSAFVFLLLISLSLARAPRWALDSGCDNTDDLKSRDGIVAAMHEARDRASAAVGVMNDHADDPRVASILRMVLGEDDFDNKFNLAKASLEGVMSFEESPADPGIGTDEWQDERTWNDVQIYCDLSRFTPRENSKAMNNGAWDNRMTFSSVYQILVEECYADVKSTTKALTANSRLPNLKRPLPPDEPRFWDRPKLPYTLDICTWFIKEWAQKGFPRVDGTLIAYVMSQEGREKLNDLNKQIEAKGSHRRLTSIDLLKTMGSTLLHELTHTRPGGNAVDESADDCYDWICVLKTKSGRNADSIAMLGLALELWKNKFMVNEDGTIQAFK